MLLKINGRINIMKFIELTEDQIKKVEMESAGQPYAVLVENLKAIGIENYIVTVSNGNVSYTSTTGNKLIRVRESEPFEPSDGFDLLAVKLAIQRTHNGNTDYNTFLKEIGAAGIHTFVADFTGMKVIYQGINSEIEYEELICKE